MNVAGTDIEGCAHSIEKWRLARSRCGAGDQQRD